MSCYSLGDTGENHQNTQAGQLVPNLGFEPEIVEYNSQTILVGLFALFQF
jgi:hypothetical protein